EVVAWSEARYRAGNAKLQAKRLTAVEARHLPLGFPQLDALLQIVALVGVGLALPDADLDLHPPVLPIHPEARERGPFDRARLLELQDLLLVDQQSAGTLRLMLEPVSRSFPRLDVTAVQHQLAPFDRCERAAQIHPPGPDRFDLGALSLAPRLVNIRDVVVAPGFPVVGDFGAHGRPRPLLSRGNGILRRLRPPWSAPRGGFF